MKWTGFNTVLTPVKLLLGLEKYDYLRFFLDNSNNGIARIVEFQTDIK